MKHGSLIAGIIVIAFLFVSFFIRGFNNLDGLDETINSSWAEAENQLKRRNDLVPNLVSTVKGYAGHEKELFSHIADARAKLAGTIQMNKATEAKVAAANELSSALSRLLVLVERYPDLKAQQSFAKLQDKLAGTENRLAVARMRYNKAVKQLNSYIRIIPGSFFAAIQGISKATYYKVEKQAKHVPVVNF